MAQNQTEKTTLGAPVPLPTTGFAQRTLSAKQYQSAQKSLADLQNESSTREMTQNLPAFTITQTKPPTPHSKFLDSKNRYWTHNPTAAGYGPGYSAHKNSQGITVGAMKPSDTLNPSVGLDKSGRLLKEQHAVPWRGEFPAIDTQHHLSDPKKEPVPKDGQRGNRILKVQDDHPYTQKISPMDHPNDKHARVEKKTEKKMYDPMKQAHPSDEAGMRLQAMRKKAEHTQAKKERNDFHPMRYRRHRSRQTQRFNNYNVDRNPVNIFLSCSNTSTPWWGQTPTMDSRTWEQKQPENQAERCYGGTLNQWFRQNQMRDHAPPTKIPGTRVNLAGRRWRVGAGNRYSVASDKIYPDRLPWGHPERWLMDRKDPKQSQTVGQGFAPYLPYEHLTHADPSHFKTQTPHFVDPGKTNYDRVTFNRN